MKIIVRENERCILFKNGKFNKIMYGGKYYLFGNSYDYYIMNASGEFRMNDYELNYFLEIPSIREELAVIDVEEQAVAIHYVDGKFDGVLESGKYAFWNVYEKHEFKILSMKENFINEEIPHYLIEQFPRGLYTKVSVEEYQKVRLYFDNKLVKLLDAGTYYFWNNGTKIDVGYVDTRLLQMDVTGQEILTLDKISLRINFVCRYKIADYIKVKTEIDDFQQQLHIAIQLALREYVGKYKLDEILENKDGIAQFVFEKLKEKQDNFFVEIYDAGVKDIIIPGDIRSIMNTVILAEKQAQANVIARREEVASTRSLLNTAKLMDENKTLYKLKELEYMERICENVGNITVNGGADLFSQLSDVLVRR